MDSFQWCCGPTGVILRSVSSKHGQHMQGILTCCCNCLFYIYFCKKNHPFFLPFLLNALIFHFNSKNIQDPSASADLRGGKGKNRTEKANIYGILVGFQRCDAQVKLNLRQLGEICGLVAVIRKSQSSAMYNLDEFAKTFKIGQREHFSFCAGNAETSVN